jgi:hypothetical protein
MESQLADYIEIQSPNRLLEVVDSLKDLQAKGVIIETSGNCKLADISRGKPWPDDMIEIHFLEKATKFKFCLSCNTYKGGGKFEKLA